MPDTGHSRAAFDGTMRLTTEVRGCACTDEEVDTGSCTRLPDRCPQEGVSGPRRSMATYPGQAMEIPPDCPPGECCLREPADPAYEYLRLFSGVDDPNTLIWGFDRRTWTEAPLVTSPGMHGSELDGEGDWLVNTDQRDDPDLHEPTDRRQNIYALHLPTMTEIRVEDWPGYQIAPGVHRGVDEWRVLFVEEVGDLPVESDLWDCSLPEM